MSRKMDPLFKLFDYACNKMYRVIYKADNCYPDEHTIFGLMIQCHGPLVVILGEKGLYYIKHKDIQLLEPVPKTFKMSEEYRSTIETYLKEEAEFRRIE